MDEIKELEFDDDYYDDILTPLTNLTLIGSYFLYNCRTLTSLDLTPLSNITSIGNYFLHLYQI